ncbi:MAG: sigma-70 family RNA polymerase sigma factor [Phycisphaerales bacterium]|nr:sigma-70 family RNA polymerase sigma factor [Phycisphaerales bacterium]
MRTVSQEQPDVLPRIAAGDRRAVRDCITRYGPMVYGMARRFLRNSASADDAVQDIFIELWKAADKFDPATARELTFVLTIARRRLIDRMRREKAHPTPDSIETVAEPPAAVPVDPVEQADQAARARKALCQLPSDQRTVLEMAIGQGLSYSQIAQQLSTPLGTIKSHARRGLMRLRQMLAAEEPSIQGR